ncbi:MAG: sensor histidine kinase, partial [Candidatus Zipacnadales bacterium]
FIRLRWLAGLGLMAASVGTGPLLGVPIQSAHIMAAAIGLWGINLLFSIWDRKLSAYGRQTIAMAQARLFANFQIGCDLLAIGLILHFSGGIENPVAFFFAFHMIIAGILLSPKMAYAQATLASLVYAAVVGLEQQGIVSHVHLGIFHPPGFYRTNAVWLVVLTVTTTLYLLVYMTTSITGRLRQREAEAAELARQVAEKAAQLETAYDELLATQKLQLAYMHKTSHELRSPLAAIASSLDVIAEGIVGELSPNQQELLDRARERVRGLMRLVDDLLTLLRSRAAPPKERFTRVGLEHVIESVTELLAVRAANEQVNLVTEVPPGLPPVWGDDELLDQIATNLIANAIKYTPAGGTVRVSLQADDKHVILKVADTGIGIAEEEQDRIFEEFYRTKGGREFQTRGTGLGLAIVKSIAEAHEAAISVESALGKGTTFTVRFPRGDLPPSS